MTIHRIKVTITTPPSPPEHRSFFLPMSRSKVMDHLRTNLPLTNEELRALDLHSEVLLEDSDGNSIRYELKDVTPAE